MQLRRARFLSSASLIDLPSDGERQRPRLSCCRDLTVARVCLTGGTHI
jgi:hypothetical protein